MSQNQIEKFIMNSTHEEPTRYWAYMREWLRAVNRNGTFGVWSFAVLRKPSELFVAVEDMAALQ
jgi:hypothetical protein